MNQIPLDPQIKFVLDMAAASERPKIWTLSPKEARDAYRQTAKILDLKPAPAMAEVFDRKIPGAAGELAARYYRPSNAGRDLLLFFHGGGFTIGDLETHDVPCRILAARAGVSVLAVDYRLAPEHKFPASSDDAVAALRWALTQAPKDFGIDPRRIAVGGDSAGGNLSTVACHRLRDLGEALPALQMLIYPGTDFAAATESHRLFAEGYFLERASMNYFRGHYLAEGDHLKPHASPLRASRFDRLPPALVFTAAFDPLRDEGRAYADAMAAAGVKTSYRCYDGLVHGFIHFTGAVKAADAAMSDMAATLRSALSAL